MDQQAERTKRENAIVLSTKALMTMPGYRLAWSQIKMMVTNGRKLTDDEVSALAAFAFLNHLNPTTGECWLLKDNDGKVMGCTVGIKGLRRKANESLGPDYQYFTTYATMNPDDSTIVHQVECTLRDTKTMETYLKLRKNAVEMLRESGSADPQGEAIELVGPPPVWKGIGYFKLGEINAHKDRNFNPRARAEKRAEAEAIKKRFDFNYDFGENPYEELEGTADTTVEMLDLQAIDATASSAAAITTDQQQEPPPDNPELDHKTEQEYINTHMPTLATYSRPAIKESIKAFVTAKAEWNNGPKPSCPESTRIQIAKAMNRIVPEGEKLILWFLFDGATRTATMDDLNDGKASAVADWFKYHFKEDQPVADIDVAIEAKEIIDYVRRKLK